MAAGVAAWGGCAETTQRDRVPFTVQDSAGIEVVDVWDPLSAGDDGWRLTDEPLVRIGAVAGQPEFQFSWIVGALRPAPDTIVVLDDESLELRFFDAGGGHLLTVGGPGEGPGELTSAGHPSPFAGGVQLNGGDKRIRFSGSGDLIADERFDWTPLQQFLCPLTFFGDDVFLCDYMPGGIPPDDGIRAPRFRLFRTDWRGERRDTLGLFSGSSTASYRMSDGSFRTVEDPFARQDLVAVGGSPPYDVSTMRTQAPKTWEDVLRMPDDGNRYEFIGGRLYMTPAPVTRHQRVVRRLWSALIRIFMDSGRGEVFSAPLLVEFAGTGDRVQPDLLFVSNERRAIIGERQVLGAPDLVVEILSPSTAHRDRGIKLDLYARHGCGSTGSWIRTRMWSMSGASATSRGTSASPASSPSGSVASAWV